MLYKNYLIFFHFIVLEVWMVRAFGFGLLEIWNKYKYRDYKLKILKIFASTVRLSSPLAQTQSVRYKFVHGPYHGEPTTRPTPI